MAVFICTLIFKINRMQTCIRLCVYICVCERVEGVGWVGEELLCGCVSKR